MNILAIDPGSEKSAWVVYSPEGFCYSFGLDDNMTVLKKLADWDHEFTEQAHLVIEKFECFGMAVGAESFETVFWSGRFAQAWAHPFSRLGRRDVKLHLCGSVRAKDANIRQSLIDKMGAPGTKKNPGKTYGISKDIWSALAVAVTFAETKVKKAEAVKS